MIIFRLIYDPTGLSLLQETITLSHTLLDSGFNYTTSMSNSFSLPNGNPKTVIVTGGAGGIGAQTIRSYHSAGCNVVVADLPFAKDAAEALISSLSDPKRAMYHPTNIINWDDMRALFRETKKRFGQVDIVIANAGLMESKEFFDFEVDESGELKEPTEAYKIVDVNLKGTMNSE
jgi:NAD(P)-dependent dehydrogenase (short-subunit alcohol dehydrogenase family)